MVDWGRFQVAGFRLSAHAAKRMVEMDVSLAEVQECLERPEQSYDQPNYGEGSRIYQRGHIAVSVVELPGNRVVKSVLWRTQETYVRPEKDGGKR